MASPGYTTFRVRGIPAESSEQKIQWLIQRALALEDASAIRLRSFAHDQARPHELVATLTFAEIPKQLSNYRATTEWSFEVSERVTLLFDTHFFGCTTLYCPPAEKWKFDLIAISGLNGHAFGSFKKKNSPYMWLRDDLPRDLLEYRVIVYGYDSKLEGSRSIQNLLDIGTKFRNAVREARPRPEKPLILLGHSLGGIVIKEALNLVRTGHTDTDRMTFKAIKGIIFFGVPSQGMDISSLIPMVGNQANRGFLHTLGQNSPVLRTQAQRFSAALEDLNCEILSFYETQESPTARKNDNGIWSMSGPPAILVDPFSATHGRLDDAQGHRIHPIDCSHSDLAKLSSSYEEAYSTVTGYLRQISHSRAALKVTLSKVEEECFRSLGFREQHQRMDSLEPAKGTCNWLIKHELFMQWFENPKGFLWIRGKPGSGKSMAMKHALMHMKSVANSDEVVASYFIHGQGLDIQKSVLGLYRSLLHQIYPYSSKSFSSLTERYEKYIRDAGESTQDAKWSWMEGEIRQCLLDGLPKAYKRIPITIFVDALDEAGEVQAKKIFKDLEVLVSSSSDPACQLRACVSCRHYPDIALNSGMTLVMEDLNGPDIASVLRTQIDALDLFNDAEKSSIKMEVLRRSEGVFQWTSLVTEAIIRTRERGDSFKVSLKHMDRVPRSLDLLYKALLEAEDELTPKHEIQQRCKLFQWVLLSARPLSPQELQQALALDREMTYRSIYDYTNSDEFITKKNLRTKIKNLSKGLIQLKGTFETGRAEFIHQSVLDFLRNSSGLQMLSGNSTMEAGQLGHFEISRRCLRYLFMAEIENVLYSLRNYDFGFNETRDPSTPVGWIGVEFPFIAYAWRYWIFHAVSAHQEGIGEEDLNIDLLKLFQWPNDQLVIQRWRPLCGFIGSPLQAWFEAFHGQSRSHGRIYTSSCLALTWPLHDSRLVHLFALCGLLGVSMQQMLFQDSRTLEIKTAKGVTPLICAIVGGQDELVRQLIRTGAVVQYDTEHPDCSPIHLASQWRNAEMVSLLINSGSQVTPPAVRCFTPLHVAVIHGNITAAETLLAAGANTEARNGQDFIGLNEIAEGTPLHFAVNKRDMSMARLLLQHGARLNARTISGRTPLIVGLDSKNIGSSETRNTEIEQLLLEHGAEVNGRADNGDTPLHRAVAHGFIQTVELLLQHGADANARNRDRRTPLHVATKWRDQEMIELLIQSGADIKAGSDDIATALSKAIFESNIVLVELLLQSGVDTNAVDQDGETPLFWAAHFGEPKATELLLEYGADPNLKNRKGETAIFKAVGTKPLFGVLQIKQMSTIRTLLQFGADPSARSILGRTPRSYSVKYEQNGVDRLLEGAGGVVGFLGEDSIRRLLLDRMKRLAAKTSGRRNGSELVWR